MLFKRAASTVSSQSAVKLVTNLAGYGQAIAEPVIYYSRVGLEFARQVGVHQKVLQPGSFADAQAGIAHFFMTFQNGTWRQVTLKQATFVTGQIGTVFGSFYVGEMIGRGSVNGYKVGSGPSHH